MSRALATPLFLLLIAAIPGACRRYPKTELTNDLEREGKQVFRYDTFGDEQFWTDTARLHEAVAHIEPIEAIKLGIKVDQDKLNLAKFVAKNPLGAGGTKELLRQDAVVGLK